MFNESVKRKVDTFGGIGENKNFLKKTVLVIFVLGITLASFFIFEWQKTERTPQKIIINGWEFPKEEGEHSNLSSEWWYFAGHLEEEGNPENKFGVTLSFGKNPPAITVNLVDGIQQKNFSSLIKIEQYDLLSRERLVIKKDENYWLEEEPFKYKTYLQFDNNEIDLNLESLKSPLSRYNIADAFYYQQTRIKVAGQLSFSGKKYRVKGWGWIDHQGFNYSPSMFLLDRQWYAIQLDNNTEIVSTRFDPQWGILENPALFLYKDTQLELIESDNYSIDYIDYWVDSETNYKYPIRFRLKIPDKDTNLEITAIVNNQSIKEIPSKPYEGSYCVTGLFEKQVVTGRAQLEFIPTR